MFNLFNRKNSKEFMEEAVETYPTPVPKIRPPDEECLYTVGPTNNGKTFLKITDGYTTMSLTMNDVAVRQMIRLLEATISELKNERSNTR